MIHWGKPGLAGRCPCWKQMCVLGQPQDQHQPRMWHGSKGREGPLPIKDQTKGRKGKGALPAVSQADHTWCSGNTTKYSTSFPGEAVSKGRRSKINWSKEVVSPYLKNFSPPNRNIHYFYMNLLSTSPHQDEDILLFWSLTHPWCREQHLTPNRCSLTWIN